MDYEAYYAKWANKSLTWLYTENLAIGKRANENITQAEKNRFHTMGYTFEGNKMEENRNNVSNSSIF